MERIGNAKPLAKHLAALGAAMACLCATLLFGLLACPAHAAVVSVRVDGAAIYSSDAKAKVSKVKGVTFKASNSTLSLNNAKIKAVKANAVDIKCSAGDTVTVKITGTSTLSTKLASIMGLRCDGNLVLKGGKLNTSNMSTAVRAAKVTLRGGTFNFKKCTSAGIMGSKGVVISGTKGGKVSVVTTDPAISDAIVSTNGSVQNSYKRLGTIKGWLGQGAELVNNGNVYRVLGHGDIALTQYNAGTQPKLGFGTKSFGSCKYGVSTICEGAFETTSGKKVTKITLGPTITALEPYAFVATSKLTNINIKDWDGMFADGSYLQLASNAFASCGRNEGKDLTVHTGRSSIVTNASLKLVLFTAGLPLQASVKK